MDGCHSNLDEVGVGSRHGQRRWRLRSWLADCDLATGVRRDAGQVVESSPLQPIATRRTGFSVACSAALANVSSPDALNAKSTSGLIGVSQARRTLSRRRSSVAVMYAVARGSLYLAFSTTARTVASSNREMMRAAQNASSGRTFSNAGSGYSGLHDVGSNPPASTD